jgi:hypothetical protein
MEEIEEIDGDGVIGVSDGGGVGSDGAETFGETEGVLWCSVRETRLLAASDVSIPLSPNDLIRSASDPIGLTMGPSVAGGLGLDCDFSMALSFSSTLDTRSEMSKPSCSKNSLISRDSAASFFGDSIAILASDTAFMYAEYDACRSP